MSQAWLPWLSACLVAALVVRWSWLTCQADSKRFVDATGAALIVLSWHPNLWISLSDGYQGDSLYTLTLPGRVGLIILTSFLILLLIYLSQLKSYWLQKVSGSWPRGGIGTLVLDLLITSVLFVVALTIVPQLYYNYYHFLFEDLPRQWVVKVLPLPIIWHILRVPQEANLATHAAALCAWWLLVLAVLNWLRTMQLAKPAWRLACMAILTNLAWHFTT